MSAEPTAKEREIAKRMFALYEEHSRLPQKAAVRMVLAEFGEGHLYRNTRGHWALNPGILEAFRELTPETVVWSKSQRVWRARRDGDPEGTRRVK